MQIVEKLVLKGAWLAPLALLGVVACSKPEPAEVVISLDETTQPLNSATVLVDYSQASAKPLMKGGEPACAVLPPDMSAGFEDDGSGTLTITVKARRGFTAPIDLAVCRMAPDTADTAVATISARLRVSVAAATDSKGEELDDRRLAMTRSGGRDVSSVPSGSETPPGDTASEAAAPSAGPGGAAVRTPGSIDTETGAAGGAASLGEALRQRSTGNATKEAQRQLDRAEREARAEMGDTDLGRGSDAAGVDDLVQDPTTDPGEENDPDVTPMTPSYDVTAEVTNDAGLIGALQFDLDHRGASGGWQGARAGVACRWLVGGGITACNDTGAGKVRCALADISGFQTPSPIVTCVFKSSETVSPASFSVQVVDASDPEFNKAGVNMSVTSVVQR
jgi:hypothetical protein